MGKKPKVSHKITDKAERPEKDKTPSNIMGFIRGNEKGLAVCAAFTLLVCSVLAMIKGSVFMVLQRDIFAALNVPFHSLLFGNYKLAFPPYFIIDLCLALSSIIFIFSMLEKRLKGPAFNLSRAAGNAFFFGMIVFLYAIQVDLFLAQKYYILQFVLWVFTAAALGMYLYSSDREGGIEVIKGGFLAPGEMRNLLIFTGVMAVIYMWDYGSWKYSFIGDEYRFYDSSIDVLTGRIPLRFFYENGAYGDHPELASIYPAFLMKIFGPGLFGWKLNSGIIPVLTIIPLYLWAKLVFRKTVAMIITVAFAFSAAMLAFSHVAHDVIHPVLPFVMSLLFAELALKKNSSFWALAAGLVMALGCYTFYSGRLTVLVVGLYWLMHPLRKKTSWAAVAACLSVYAGTIAFIFLNPEFLNHMLVHSVFKGSEVGNAADRPVYMALNFIHTFFSFIHKSNFSHYMAGAAADWFTAIGMIAGLAWAIFLFKKDWRARWLLLSYIVLVVFIGAIVQYTYPPNTRVNFLAPMISIFAGVGLSRLASAAVFFRKNPMSRYRTVIACVLLFIAVNNIYRFYVYMPRVFSFTVESYMVKYMKEKADKSKKYTVVTDDFPGHNKLAFLYGYDKNFSSMQISVFDQMIRGAAAEPGVYMFSADTLSGRQYLIDAANDSDIILNYENRPVITVFDLTGAENYKKFTEMWQSGRLPAGAFSAKKTNPKAEPAGTRGFAAEIKKGFQFEGSYRAMRGSEISGVKLSVLKLDHALFAPSDMVVNGSGDTLYVADSGAWKILKFTRAGDGGYKLSNKFDPASPGMLGFLKPSISDGSTGPLSIALDPGKNLLYVLDARGGRINCFSGDGKFMKEVASGGYLKECSSLAVSRDGRLLAAANPETNMFVTIGADGSKLNSYATTNGMGMGQLNRPSYAGFDSANNYYIADTLNGRVDKFDAEQRYIINYRLGLLSREQYPRLVVFDRAVKKPYFAVTQPETKKVFFYLLGEDAFRTASIAEAGGVKLVNPAAISADEKGAMYILDTKVKMIVKLEIPAGAMDEYIKIAPRR